MTGPNLFYLKKNTFLRYIALQVDDASLAMISFTVRDLLLYFLSVFLMACNVAANFFLRIRSPVEAAAGRVLRTTGDAAVCVLSAFFDNPYRVTASYTKKI